jgi:hypothetical protein
MEDNQSQGPDIRTLSQGIASTARRLYTASLSRYDEDWAVRMRTPTPGDLVVEVTAYFRPVETRVGKLVSITDEPYPYENWDEAYEGRPVPTRPIYTIVMLEGKTIRWENCQFVALPTTEFDPL